ncbi:lipoprotein [Spiroplasma endosymbiont of Polydrusus pterygomalis]|uniref:lipoprotein n=1 Tax=Spiroplasma endosymbiont of Polydrusus pterygomalis TaxID=3139327 RepID=UPI003CCAA00E
MKKILTFLGIITLIGTSATSLVACDNIAEYTPEELKHLKKENQINTTNKNIKDNLEWIAPQEKPFNQIDDKYYFVVWRNNSGSKWIITKFKNDTETSKENGKRKIVISEDGLDKLFILMETEEPFKGTFKKYSKDVAVTVLEGSSKFIKKFSKPPYKNYFKSVYRWNLDTSTPYLVVDKDGSIKVN